MTPHSKWIEETLKRNKTEFRKLWGLRNKENQHLTDLQIEDLIENIIKYQFTQRLESIKGEMIKERNNVKCGSCEDEASTLSHTLACILSRRIITKLDTKI